MEFVLVLPFIWLILALTTAVGAAMVVSHRAVVAAREAGFYDAFVDSGDFGRTSEQVRTQVMTPRGADGSCRIVDRVDSPDRFSLGSLLGDAMTSLRGVQQYECSARPTRYMRIFGARQSVAKFTTESGTWRYEEVSGYSGIFMSIVRKALSGIGSLISSAIGALFR